MTLTIFTSLDHISNLNCRQAFYCLLRIDEIIFGIQTENNNRCEPLVNHCSSTWLVMSEHPIMFGLFQFVYLTNRSTTDFEKNIMPDFLCFNSRLCPALIFCIVDIGMRNGLNCCRTISLINDTLKYWDSISQTFTNVIQRCSTIGTDKTCSHPSLFHCSRSSKCISKHRLADGSIDCYFGEDESFSTCQLNDSSRFICQSEPNKCLSMIVVQDSLNNCLDGEDEWTEYQHNIHRGYVPFGLLCNGLNELLPMNNANDTDETHCEWWPCNNSYVRCDNFWQCLNGDDELNCPGTQCSLNEHSCENMLISKQHCIPALHLMESYSNCETSFFYRSINLNNETLNNTMHYFLWNETKCITSGHICSGRPLLSPVDGDVCLMQTNLPPIISTKPYLSINNQIFCTFLNPLLVNRKTRPFLITSRLNYFPPTSTVLSVRQNIHSNSSKTFNRQINDKKGWYCNRGILFLFEDNKTEKCLCPPSYFGDRCEWQNQRISLTLQLIYRTSTYILSVFQVIIMIIDEQRQIASYHEQITYVPKHDCGTKFNLYLLYPDQPKNSSTNYSIHIDIFDKIKLKYWASWHLSIPFQFLPVNRIAAQLFIPTEQQSESCPLFCGINGKCIRYINKKFSYFCQCDQGYSGLRCDIKHVCSCSSDSHCLTSSICVCPMNKFGSKCYLKHSICHSSNSSCDNNGLCVPIDDRIALNNFTCFCTEEFYGTRCENTKNRIDIEFDEEIIREISTVFVHYITAFENVKNQHTTTFKKIMFGYNRITLFVKQPFHILFIELFNRNYYLAVLRERFIESEYIQTKLLSNQQCFHINELLNSTFRSYHFLHRVKYYPLLCRQYKQVMCFYDEKYMCICDQDRFSNCFLFNYSTIYNCQGYSDCKNDGQCFQDNTTCPTVSICVCPDCFYGTKCQFSTQGFVLSLDYILGYHIKPNVSFSQQPSLVKVSISITTLMFVFGIISGSLSIVTFRMKKTRDVGSGFYLLVSSWTSMLTLTMLLIKFWHLVLSQMEILTNRSLLTFNCILLDIILKVLLALNDWLYGCVSIERVITVSKGVSFSKSKSKRIAKWVTLSILLCIIITHLHDPIHRHLIDDIDTDEQRTWCLVQYSFSINVFNSFITLFHFFIPFVINLISIIFIVISIARTRSNIQPRLTFKEHLQLQLKQYKHHLIATCALVLLALPRLIISFMSGCMKSPNNSWLFLIGYLISFLPSMMTFIVFVLPSKTYKDEFNTVIERTIRRFRSAF